MSPTREKGMTEDRRTQRRTTDERWRTALTRIEPNKIILRGYPLDEVMGRLTFGETIYLLLMGEVPSPALGRLMESLLFGLVNINLFQLAGLVAVLASVALLAAYLPARRAARVDPMTALRES